METQEQKQLLPTFGRSFGHGWDTMIRYFLILLLVTIILGIITGPMAMGNFNFNKDDFHWDQHSFDWFNPGFAALGILAFFMGLFALAYGLLIVPVIKYGGDFMYVQAVRGKRPEFDTLIKGFKENYLYIVLANLLTGALVMLGFIFLIIPGIIVACRLSFVSYLVMDKKMDPIVAVEESWKLTRGHGWRIFGMAIVSFFLGILGFALMFVGIIPVIMWVKGAFASLYEAVLIEKNGQLEPVVS